MAVICYGVRIVTESFIFTIAIVSNIKLSIYLGVNDIRI
jgi:hypothetical protein